MEALAYFLLSALTLVIVALAAMIYRETKHVGFPFGIGLLYYWSLWGSWFLIHDKATGLKDTTYETLENMMFPVHLDGHYLHAIALYGAFLVVIELTLLALTRRRTDSEPPFLLVLSHRKMVLLIFGLGLLTLLLGMKVLLGAHAAGTSVYLYKNGPFSKSPLFGLFHLVTRSTLLLSLFGLAVAAAGKKGRLIRGEEESKRWLVAYSLLFLLLLLFNLVLGAKSLLFGCVISVGLFYFANLGIEARRGVLVKSFLMTIAGAFVLGLINISRGVPLDKLWAKIGHLTPRDFLMSYYSIFTSNESFAAHFSLYGVIAQNIPLLYGQGLINLLLTLVPRALWRDRRETYDYYALQAGLDPSAGYSIHHATDWYLNFGTLGLIAGALILGWIWATFYNLSFSPKEGRKRWVSTLCVVGPWLFIGFFPQFIRGGIEVYKAFLIGYLLLPTCLIAVAVRSPRE